MAKKPLPAPDELRKLLRYEPDTGKLFWRERHAGMFATERDWKWWNGRFAGKEAFTADSGIGYRRGCIFNRTYLAHRVIWAMETGAWPVDEIDHINHDRSNNRWKNLREVFHRENGRNVSRSITNSSGVTGVHWSSRDKRWVAHIRDGGSKIYLGSFDDLAVAAVARADAETKYGFHKNHGRLPIV